MSRERSRNITLADLDRLDNGSFERMVEEIREFAKDESEVEYYMHIRIMEGLARRAQKERMGLPTFPLEFDDIPRKKRTVVMFREAQPCIGEEQEVGLAVKQENPGRNVGKHAKKRCRGPEDEEGNLLRKKKKKVIGNVNFAELGLDPPPELPIHLREEVEKRGGNNLMLVIMKELFATDLNPHNARFSIPASQIKNPEFLREEEKDLLKKKEGNKKTGLNVTLIDPCLDECNLCLKEWPMNSTITYTLISGWNKVFQKNNLQVEDIVQLWSFRCENKLWFLLNKVIPQSRVDGNKCCSSVELTSSPESVITSHELQE